MDTVVVPVSFRYHTYYSMCDTDVSKVSSVRNTAYVSASIRNTCNSPRITYACTVTGTPF